MRDEDYGADGPLGYVVGEDVQIRGAVGENGTFHFGIGGVDNSGADWFRLAF